MLWPQSIVLLQVFCPINLEFLKTVMFPDWSTTTNIKEINQTKFHIKKIDGDAHNPNFLQLHVWKHANVMNQCWWTTSMVSRTINMQMWLCERMSDLLQRNQQGDFCSFWQRRVVQKAEGIISQCDHILSWVHLLALRLPIYTVAPLRKTNHYSKSFILTAKGLWNHSSSHLK